jgi:hypothetical protein
MTSTARIELATIVASYLRVRASYRRAGQSIPTYGDDASAETFWARLRAEAPSRKLGEANACVARSLLFATDTPLLLEGEAEAAAELQATGWVEWVDRCLPGEGSLLCPPRLPAALIAHMRATPLRPWLEALSADLAARAASSS